LARAQLDRVAKVGILAYGNKPNSPVIQAFRSELRNLGCVEGRNLAVASPAKQKLSDYTLKKAGITYITKGTARAAAFTRLAAAFSCRHAFGGPSREEDH
jgi:hypothetical protein